MNEIDSLSQSDTTSDLPSILRDKLEISADFDFMNPSISPRAKSTIAEMMGLDFNFVKYPVESTVELSKNALFLKLKNMPNGQLHEITEEWSEEIDLTIVDNKDNSILFEKYNISLSDVKKGRFYSECLEDDDPVLQRLRIKSTIASAQTSPPVFDEAFFDNMILADDSIRSFELNRLGEFSSSTKKESTIKKTDDCKNVGANNIKPLDFGTPVLAEKEEELYMEQIERFKKKKKPLEVINASEDMKFQEFHFSNIKRVTITTDQTITCESTNLGATVTQSNTNSTSELMAHGNSMNPEISQKTTESTGSFSRSLLKPGNLHKSTDDFDNTKHELNRTVNDSKLSSSKQSKDMMFFNSKLLSQKYSHCLNQHRANKAYRSQLFSKDSKFSLYANQNFSVVSQCLRNAETKSMIMSSSIPGSHKSKLGAGEQESKLLLGRLYEKLSAKSKKTLRSVTKLKGETLDREYLGLTTRTDDKHRSIVQTEHESQRSFRQTESNVNSKLKMFFQNNPTGLKSKILIQHNTRLEIGFRPDDKLFTNMRARKTSIRTKVSSRTTESKNCSLNSLEDFGDKPKKDDYRFSLTEIPSTTCRNRLSSKRPDKLKSTNIPIQVVTVKPEKLEAKTKPVSNQQSLPLHRLKSQNDYIKINRQDVDKHRDAGHGLLKTQISNSKMFLKARDLSKRDIK